MNTYRMTGARKIVLALFMLITVPTRNALAQGAPAGQGKGESVIIALVPNRVMPVATVKLVRDYRNGRANIVYLRLSSASSGLLQSALTAFVISHLENPRQRNEVSFANLALKGGESSDSATRVLFASLMKSTPRPVGEAGMVPAMLVTLPDDARLKEKFKGRYRVKAESD